jgi:hypothetical protein
MQIDAVITNQVIVCTDALRSGRSTAYSYFLRCVLGSHLFVTCLIVLRWPGLGLQKRWVQRCTFVRRCLPHSQALTRVCQRRDETLQWGTGEGAGAAKTCEKKSDAQGPRRRSDETTSLHYIYESVSVEGVIVPNGTNAPDQWLHASLCI